MIKFDEIKAEMIARLPDLAKDLVPDGKRKGKYWIGRNPTRADKHAGSFWILMETAAAGAWRDEAGRRGVDEGDVIGLVRYVLALKDMAETRRECLKWLGWADGPALQLTPQEQERRARLQAEAAEQRRRDDAAREAERREHGGVSALRLWLKAAELTPRSFPGSLLERYFLSRAIDMTRHLVERRRPLPGALRFFSAHDYHTEDGEVIEGLPCMAALMSGPDGRPQALHRTWLAPDGGGKAVLPEPDDNGPRKIWGPPKGAVIRISKGAGALTPEKAALAGLRLPVVITEGIEDALACALAMPDWRVWAAGTLGNIAHVPALACVDRFIVCRDNDWDKPQAVAAFEDAIAALKRHGRPVRIAASPRGKDMNDLLKGETT